MFELTNLFNGYRKRKYLAILLAFAGFIISASSTAAVVFDKTHSPYKLDETLTISENDTLLIFEGTTIIIDTSVDIVVYGTMLIKGTPAEPVSLLPAIDTLGWGRIYLHQPDANCVFEHVKIVDGAVLSLDANLTMRHVDFINRQDLPLHYNITRLERAKADFQACTIEGSGKGEGFLLINTTDAIIRNCSFYNIPDAIEITKLKDSRISNNLFVNTPDDAIDLNNCEDVLVDSNIILHAHDRGLEIGSEIFGSSKSIIVHRNLIINCQEGITFKEGSTGFVLNNTLFQNKIGVVSKEIGPTPGGSTVSVENTIFSQSVWADIDTDSLSTVSVNYSLSDMGNLSGSSNQNSDPLFLDPENNNFTLQSTSPCIDAGNSNSPIDPDGTLSDLGAYFYNQDTASTVDSNLAGIQSVQLFPNPFSNDFRVKFVLTKTAPVRIELMNMSGQKVSTLFDKTILPGNYDISCDLLKGPAIPEGIYFCIVSIDDDMKTIKAIKFN